MKAASCLRGGDEKTSESWGIKWGKPHFKKTSGASSIRYCVRVVAILTPLSHDPTKVASSFEILFSSVVEILAAATDDFIYLYILLLLF